MEQSELDQLRDYLAQLFGYDDLAVLQHPEDDDQALVAVDQSFFARILRDEDEGELSYSFSKELPDEPHEDLDASLKSIFNSPVVQLKKRPNKADSSEVYKGEEFLGVIYDDDSNPDGMLIFNMAILDIDLDPPEEAD